MAKTRKNKIFGSIVIFLLVGFALGFFLARFKYKNELRIVNTLFKENNETLKAAKGKLNKVFMADGKMYLEKDGDITVMEENITLSDGTVVQTDGKIIKKDGTEKMMKDTDAIDMEANPI